MRMVDIGKKGATVREAMVEAKVYLRAPVVAAIKKKRIPKGDVLEVARVSGILAAKKTPQLIPLCHPIPIEYAEIDFAFGKKEIKIKATIRGRAKTGMEMEALVAASMAALTIYDMCKPLDKDIVISDIKLVKKTGGKSGTYKRK